MALFLRQRWRRQPEYAVELDRSHPLARGLGGLILYNAGQWRELVGNYALDRRLTVNQPSPVGIGNGLETIDGNATGIVSTDARSQHDGEAQITLFVHGFLHPIELTPSGTGEAQQISRAQCQIARPSFSPASDVYFLVATQSFEFIEHNATGLLAYGRPYTVALSRVAGNNGLVCYHNGRAINTQNGGTGNHRGDPASQFFNLSLNARENRGSGLTIPIGLSYRRVLDDGEHRALHENPWQMLAPERRFAFFSLPVEPPPPVSAPTPVLLHHYRQQGLM